MKSQSWRLENSGPLLHGDVAPSEVDCEEEECEDDEAHGLPPLPHEVLVGTQGAEVRGHDEERREEEEADEVSHEVTHVELVRRVLHVLRGGREETAL